MQKLLFGLVFTVVLIFPAGGGAAYVIKLKNGNEFVTARYWQEGKVVMFDTYGGVFGIDRAFVTKIEESNQPIRLISTVQEAPEEKSPPAPVKDQQEAKQSSLAPDAGKASDDPKRKDDPIVKDFSALKERFKGVDGMLTSELQELSKELASIKRRIQLSGKANDYLPEYTEAFQMGNTLEAALNARR